MCNTYKKVKESRERELLASEQRCKRCGNVFHDKRKRKLCLSCAGKFSFENAPRHKFARHPPCLWCGKQCLRHDNNGFCSWECACRWKVYQRHYEAEKQWRLFERGMLEFVDSMFIPRFEAKRFQLMCRVAWLLKRRQLALSRVHVCSVCGKLFERKIGRRGWTKFCSADCWAKGKKAAKKAGRRSDSYRQYKHTCANNRRRARKFGTEYDSSVRSVKVFERDGWRCRICGRPTPRELLGKPRPNSPTLDHIIPMSKGGGHTWDSVQCACRECNTLKGNKFCEPWLFPIDKGRG